MPGFLRIKKYVKFARLPKLLQDIVPELHKNAKSGLNIALDAADSIDWDRDDPKSVEKVVDFAKRIAKKKKISTNNNLKNEIFKLSFSAIFFLLTSIAPPPPVVIVLLPLKLKIPISPKIPRCLFLKNDPTASAASSIKIKLYSTFKIIILPLRQWLLLILE